MNSKLRLVLSISILFVFYYGSAQDKYWQRKTSAKDLTSPSLQKLDVGKVRLFSLNRDSFSRELDDIPHLGSKSKTIYFPDEKGAMIPFHVYEAPVMSPALAAKYPQIKSYVGHSLEDKNKKIRFSVSHKGIQSMIVHADDNHTTFMQKANRQGNTYVVYRRDSETDLIKDFVCNTKSIIEKSANGITSKLVDDQVLRKFRIAISATGEYTDFHGGAVADALAAINATLTRVNEVFETDLGVTLELVANNDQVIFTDAATDPYSNNLNTEVQNELSDTIGEANYDVGHLFHRDNDNGNAGFIGSVCKDNQKGSAFSSAMSPEGDVFDLDFVAHELGHQFGANHTWSQESEGTLVQAEPASGTTIMGYAGIAPGNNVAPNGDDYFHYNSILQITQYLETVSCGEQMAIANNPPIIVPTGNFVIPKSTAFVLTGNASDPDAGDVLTYAWEQIDDGVVTTASFGPTNPSGANFRSRPPSTNPSRYFPRLAEVVKGNLTQTSPLTGSAWETVSDVERELNFALTVRDNADGGGQVASNLVNIMVVNSSGPFKVTSQATQETYIAGTLQNITWDVADTDKSPVNTQTVDIFLSVDGGLTFPTLLAEGVPNDGIQEVVLPGTATTEARIMIKASGNIFFAVNSSNFTIQETEFVLDFEGSEFEVCQPDDLVVPFIYKTYDGFNEEATFTATGLPAGLNVNFSPNTATADDTSVNVTFSNTAGVPVDNYPITITATTASISKDIVIDINIYDSTFSNVALTSPADTMVDVSMNQALEWEADPAYTSYDVELATDAAFTNVLESATVLFNSYKPTGLQQETVYFWRVKPKNSCGEGTFGTPFSFRTVKQNCSSRSATGLPLTISTSGTPTVVSRITFPNDLPIADVNVNLDIDHTFLADLVITLTSPSGTIVALTSNSCGEFDNINAVFDNDGNPIACGVNPAISGTVRPLGSLSSFNGESSFGEWVLTIVDNAAADGGTLNAFSLEICVEGELRPDDDQDGVFDDGDDLCLGTPLGTEVDTSGCPIFRFPPDNFTVAIESESCIPSNDGSIGIMATQSMEYVVTISGNGADDTANFTDSFKFDNLSAGTYSLCITGTDGTVVFEEFCFDAVVSQPEPLSVTSKLSADGKQAILTLEGADIYNIELNGNTTQVEASEISLDLKDGINTLKVSTRLSCQGTYEEQFFVSDQLLIYPNPFVNIVRAFLGTPMENVDVAIYTSDGRLVSRENRSTNGNELSLDFTGLQSGMYFISFDGKNIKGTYKVIKR